MSVARRSADRIKGWLQWLARPIPFWPLFLWIGIGVTSAATVTIDASKTYQTIEGFGVNANHRSWGNDLKPVLDQLIDDAGMTMFRVVLDNADWETNNDNGDPQVMNWAYYQTVYSSPEFQKLWGLMAYLNQKGLTNGVMPNFQGFGPYWMSPGGSGFQSLAVGMEDEWAEMVTSAMMYARFTNHLQFKVVGPNNEPNIPGVGVGIANGTEYALTLHKLAQQFDAHGLSDLRFVGPDLSPISNGGTDWLPEMIADPVIMAKLGHIGLHSYSPDGYGSANVADLIAQSAYPDRTFWLTEFNVWCSTCNNSTGTNTWSYARGAAEYLLGHLATGASACLLWDGYDSPYLNTWDDNVWWSTWGLFAADTNSVPISYTPRRTYYTFSQISKYVRPGARRIDVSGSTGSLRLLAFYHSETNQLTITGVNPDANPVTLSGTLASLPGISNLDLYFTTSGVNLHQGTSVAVSNGEFSVDVPPDSVFTLVGLGPASSTNSLVPTSGTYHGLFAQADRDHQHSGSFALTLTRNGNYTGTLRRGANSFALRGKFDGLGRATNTVVEARTNHWTVAMNLDLAGAAEWLAGSVGDGQWSSELVANRAVFNTRTNPATTFARKYTMVIPGETSDDGTILEGDGGCAVTVSAAGSVALSGFAADGAALRQTVPLGQTGEWPLYLSLNGGKDSILGWITNQSGGGLQGVVSWIKTARLTSKLYPSGLTNLTVATGWPYTPPTSSTPQTFPANLIAILEDGNLPGPLTNSLQLTAASKFIASTTSNKLSLTLTKATGLLSGSVTPPGTTRRAAIHGAISQELGAGFGYFLSTNRSGRLLLEAPQ